ncbi:dimethylallyl tryptophan synthase [Penicillium longicatenatum]|nr:dimethylallyl tryptophan synthase [Penicillium longicatenatum]
MTKPTPENFTHRVSSFERPVTSPIDVITQTLPLLDKHQAQWWKHAGPRWARFLEVARYGIHEQYQYLLFLHQHILPALGPYQGQYKSMLTPAGMPLEFSLNFRGNSSESTARVAIEPISALSGTEEDPYSKATGIAFVDHLESLGIAGFDTRIFDVISKAICPPNDQSNHPSLENFWKTSYMLGFDTAGGKVSTKAYAVLAAMHLTTLRSIEDIVNEPLTQIGQMMGCSDAVALTHQYLMESSSYAADSLISWDMTDPPKSRLKLYSYTSELVLGRVEGIWTLGGRLKNDPVVSKGLDLSVQLWEILGMKDRPPSLHDTPESPENLPLQWNYEIQAGKPYPATKIYYPLVGMNDLDISKRISKFFNFLGWPERAQSYVSNVEKL